MSSEGMIAEDLRSVVVAALVAQQELLFERLDEWMANQSACIKECKFAAPSTSFGTEVEASEQNGRRFELARDSTSTLQGETIGASGNTSSTQVHTGSSNVRPAGSRVGPSPTTTTSAGSSNVESPFSMHLALAKDRLGHLVEYAEEELDNPDRNLHWLWVTSPRFSRWTHTPLFHIISVLAIVGNAVALAFEVDQAAKNPQQFDQDYHNVISTCFTLFFAVEVAFRVFAKRLRFFFNAADWAWNLADFVIVAVSTIELFQQTSNVTFLRLIRVARLARIIRIIRMHDFFRELRMMFFSIVGSIKSLIWVVLVLSMVIYMFAVALTRGVTEHVQTLRRDGQPVPEQLTYYYGSLFSTCYTLLIAMFGGNDWEPLLELLRPVGTGYYVIFVSYVAFMSLAVLNIVTGVFVETAMQGAQQDTHAIVQEEMRMAQAHLKDIRNLFSLISGHNRGEVNFEQFNTMLDEPVLRTYFHVIGIEVSQASALFRLLDTDDSGCVSADEFAMGCVRLKGEAKNVDVATLMYEHKRMVKTITGLIHTIKRQHEDLVQRVSTWSRNDIRKAPLADNPSLRLVGSARSPTQVVVFGESEQSEPSFSM